MEPFKERLGLKNIKIIASAVQSVYPEFSKTKFFKDLEKEIPALELKQRMELIAQALMSHLPEKVETLFPILIQSAQKLDGFLVWPHTHVVTCRGLEKGKTHLKLSMDALYEMTQVFTSEFAIREFLIQYPDETLKILNSWLDDPSEHVRRLISEGTRPLLPWGKRLDQFVKDPTRTWELLEHLKNDPSIYVRKSVANHINDHSKNHVDWILKKLSRWKKQNDQNVNWVILHGSRTMIKKGSLQALALQGVKAFRFKFSGFELSSTTLRLGQTLESRFKLKNLENKTVKIILDQSIDFLKKNDELSDKVFKGKNLQMRAFESLRVILKLPLREVTTRVYYPGQHTYTLLLNGAPIKTSKFLLKL